VFWIGNIVKIFVPPLGLVAALVLAWQQGLSWVGPALLVGMAFATGVAVTVGNHRLFTHRAFEAHQVVRITLAILAMMTVEGPLLWWVSLHRRHHQKADQLDDPHSPHFSGPGFLGFVRGMWFAQVGWLFQPDPPDHDHYNKDLRQERALRVVSALYPVWVVLGLVIPTVLGGLLIGTWMGAVTGFLWGGLARIFFVHHITLSISTVCHMWGQRPYDLPDHSTNNVVMGILAFGEGWHNNHHAFPYSARQGLRWWQLDLSYGIICTLAWLGLAWGVKLPPQEALKPGGALAKVGN
jgi:stearoyl-CoA desaturase (delta-9 desaturase)